jgi:hypothetical protein
MLKLSSLVNPEEKADFDFDIKKIDFVYEGAVFAYGIQRYYLKQDVPMIESGYTSILQKN